MRTLSIDFETRSTVELRDTGVYPYARHPDTDIWCMAYAFDGEEPKIWIPSQPDLSTASGLPREVVVHIQNGGAMRAHNAQFERIIWREIVVPRYGAPAIFDSQWYDSAAEAAAMQLPRSLDALGAALGSPQLKDKEGHALMLRMARPRKIHDDGSLVWWDVPERLEKLYEYCKQDVRTEMALSKFLRRLDPAEREVYLLDQRINDRGFHFDRDLVLAAKEIAAEGTRRANSHLEEITSGAVATVTNSGSLRKWLAEQGIETDSVDKKHVAEMLDDPDLPEKVRFALQVRVDGARSSVAKLQSMLEYAGNTDRLCGMLLYHGAGTGRWSGKGPQPQNYPRGTVKKPESFIPLVLAGEYDKIQMFGEHPLAVVSSLLRACLIAKPGYDLMAGDYSAIEARVLNVIAGQWDIVKLFFDGVDVYKHNATKLYRELYDAVTDAQRQGGKFQELGCGFGMGLRGARKAQHMYGLDLGDDDLKAVIDNYRMTHPAVVQLWSDANDALIQAAKTPGVPVDFGANDILRAFVTGNYLYIRLPSKRVLCYPAPSVVMAEVPWSTEDKPVWKETIQIYGVDPFNRQWGPIHMYGGLIVENIVQAIARDLMAEAMLRLDAGGYPVVCSIHDELVCEVPKGEGTIEEFTAFMTDGREWTKPFPITAAAWRGERYKK